MPTKRLPASADIKHLKSQAKDLLADVRSGKSSAYQRIREFHPKLTGLADADLAACTFSLSDALLSIAREYGFASWPRLKTVVAEAAGHPATFIHNDRIEDGLFKQALDFLDEGNAQLLQQHLAAHPDLVHQTVVFEGENYFSNPTLLEFIAENPTRQDSLPANIVDIAQIILEAGAKTNQQALDETLMLVASGRVVREYGVQERLLHVLCDNGADPEGAVQSALVHSEIAAVRILLDRGARFDLVVAAALDQFDDVAALVTTAHQDELQMALSMAAQNNGARAIPLLIQAGADPDRYNPPGGHSHCTPLHSAVAQGHVHAMEALIMNGARQDIGDIHHNATAIEWASHFNDENVLKSLRS